MSKKDIEIGLFQGQVDLDRWDRHQKNLDEYDSKNAEKGGRG